MSRQEEYSLFVGKPADTELNYGTFEFPDKDYTPAVDMGVLILSHATQERRSSDRIASYMRTLAAFNDRPEGSRNLFPYTVDQMQRMREGAPAYFLELQTQAVEQLGLSTALQELPSDPATVPEPRQDPDSLPAEAILPNPELRSA